MIKDKNTIINEIVDNASDILENNSLALAPHLGAHNIYYVKCGVLANICIIQSD